MSVDVIIHKVRKAKKYFGMNYTPWVVQGCSFAASCFQGRWLNPELGLLSVRSPTNLPHVVVGANVNVLGV